MDRRAIHWHLANLEYGCATALHNVSLSWWDQYAAAKPAEAATEAATGLGLETAAWHPLTDGPCGHRSLLCPRSDAPCGDRSLLCAHRDDGNDFSGEHVVVSNGFERMVYGLSRYLEILLEREVTSIEHSADGVGERVRIAAGDE